MNDKDLHKLAAVAIRELQSEVDSLKAQLEKRAYCEKLAFNLFDSGMIAISDIPEKITELYGKELADLETTQRAIELTKKASTTSLFKLSHGNSTSYSNLDPLTRGILEDFYN